MNKRILSLLFALMLCVAITIPTFAVSDSPRLVDDADILTDYEETELLSLLDEISERQQFDVVIVTVDSIYGEYIQDYADDYYDYNGYGFGSRYDGALLLLDMDMREWYISTCGYGITALTDAGIDYIGDQMVPDLSDGYYYDAFVTYTELCDEFVTQAKNGTPYDVTSLPKEDFNVFSSILFSLIVGFIIALIIVLIMKSKLKSVHFKSAASDYVKSNSMKVTASRDLFLYRTVNRVKKAENSSGGSRTHSSSSGRSHGGGGGRF